MRRRRVAPVHTLALRHWRTHPRAHTRARTQRGLVLRPEFGCRDTASETSGARGGRGWGAVPADPARDCSAQTALRGAVFGCRGAAGGNLRVRGGVRLHDPAPAARRRRRSWWRRTGFLWRSRRWGREWKRVCGVGWGGARGGVGGRQRINIRWLNGGLYTPHKQHNTSMHARARAHADKHTHTHTHTHTAHRRAHGLTHRHARAHTLG